RIVIGELRRARNEKNGRQDDGQAKHVDPSMGEQAPDPQPHVEHAVFPERDLPDDERNRDVAEDARESPPAEAIELAPMLDADVIAPRAGLDQRLELEETEIVLDVVAVKFTPAEVLLHGQHGGCRREQNCRPEVVAAGSEGLSLMLVRSHIELAPRTAKE